MALKMMAVIAVPIVCKDASPPKVCRLSFSFRGKSSGYYHGAAKLKLPGASFLEVLLVAGGLSRY
jgi:hypothetical protein